MPDFESAAYREIVALGEGAVPLLLREVEARTGHWFRALEEITGEDPVAEDDWGDYEAMRRRWLEWAAACSVVRMPIGRDAQAATEM
jgi:hypothetical protein